MEIHLTLLVVYYLKKYIDLLYTLSNICFKLHLFSVFVIFREWISVSNAIFVYLY